MATPTLITYPSLPGVSDLHPADSTFTDNFFDPPKLLNKEDFDKIKNIVDAQEKDFWKEKYLLARKCQNNQAIAWAKFVKENLDNGYDANNPKHSKSTEQFEKESQPTLFLSEYQEYRKHGQDLEQINAAISQHNASEDQVQYFGQVEAFPLRQALSMESKFL